MARVLFCHDQEGFAEARAELWNSEGYDVISCDTARRCLEIIQHEFDGIETVIVHKDLSDYSGETIGFDEVVQAIHERNDRTRIGVISGEFPVQGHVKRREVDFFFPTRLDPFNPWLLKQLALGYVNNDELSRRGRSVEIPPGDFGKPERRRFGVNFDW